MSDPAGPDDERGSLEHRHQPYATPPLDGEVAWDGRRASLARRVRGGARAAVSALADRLIDVAPRIPVRDLETLRRQFPGLGPEQIADKLVTGATTGTAGVGAGVGAAAALPVPPAMTAELAAETIAVAAVEYKLIAELHEVYGLRAPGSTKQRVAAYLGAWAQQRGISVTKPASFDAALGGQLKRQLRQRLVRRTARNLPTLTPFMIGAVVGAVFNRRSTHALADKVRADLRTRQIPWDRLPPAGD
ncbi:hypothetical protein POF43_024895 [Streptomyces sp. SL54]|uniref:EcsC family protein n=1 Tax=Streptantibioticus silvisoli TaxID=2705255 RepID=A0ABT6W596_9ACTN|nr:hypothetical protein [Streptantibioticus silvisoli]MDI5965925.1 hypothetical protein [Streptantibioticus silvisoli]